ncbi:hypothetical protein WMY93_026605 [Mugilogobius chulae]|uniref:Protein kinase domain-containing protein n=1 Tax=Mugilogobius chulae TaxID=88201 RepID=A0AAW0N1E2_9GOBI
MSTQNRQWLGGGAYGNVYKEWFNGQWCAMKEVEDHPGCTTDELMARENEMYRTVNHPNVVKLVGQIHKQAGLWRTPMELIQGQNLYKVMFHPMQNDFQITLPIKSRIITGMCEGLLYLHNKNIIHRDLKPDNIMVENHTFRPVIIDLGLAKFEYGDFYSGRTANHAYAAPEIINQPFTKRSSKSDVWALGKIIAELLVGYEIYPKNPAHYQVLLQKHPEYCEVVAQMIDNPIPRATMNGIIGRIREAEGLIEDNQSLVLIPRPRASSMEFPPNFTLPNPLPPNHIITLNYITHNGMGEVIKIKGEIHTRAGRVHRVWWMKCVPNTLDMNHLPRYLK